MDFSVTVDGDFSIDLVSLIDGGLLTEIFLLSVGSVLHTSFELFSKLRFFSSY